MAADKARTTEASVAFLFCGLKVKFASIFFDEYWEKLVNRLINSDAIWRLLVFLRVFEFFTVTLMKSTLDVYCSMQCGPGQTHIIDCLVAYTHFNYRGKCWTSQRASFVGVFRL
jgi:hypothetical protein